MSYTCVRTSAQSKNHARTGLVDAAKGVGAEIRDESLVFMIRPSSEHASSLLLPPSLCRETSVLVGLTRDHCDVLMCASMLLIEGS